MTNGFHGVDVRRRAGWLPQDQDDLESWLAGHRERVEAKGGQVVLHPVLTEFQELLDHRSRGAHVCQPDDRPGAGWQAVP